MLTIRLFCNAGLSTSLLVERLRAEARERGIEADVASLPASEASGAAGADCVLLAPQAGGHLSHAREACDALGVPAGVIPAVDYGTVNAPRMLDLALKLANEQTQ